MSNKEYWIIDKKGEQLRATYTKSYDEGAVRVIEYSAYEKLMNGLQMIQRNTQDQNLKDLIDTFLTHKV